MVCPPATTATNSSISNINETHNYVDNQQVCGGHLSTFILYVKSQVQQHVIVKWSTMQPKFTELILSHTWHTTRLQEVIVQLNLLLDSNFARVKDEYYIVLSCASTVSTERAF